MDLIEAGAGTLRRHLWELARFDFFHPTLGRDWLAKPARRVLDIGAGDGRFDQILLTDVLEHIGDDHGFLADATRRYPWGNARVLISVPAWPGLFSRHDQHLGHFRRYTPRSARDLIEVAGLRMHRSGGLFHALLPVRALAVGLQRARQEETPVRGLGDWFGRPLITAAIAGILKAEGELSRLFAKTGLGVPGVKWWALCEIPRS